MAFATRVTPAMVVLTLVGIAAVIPRSIAAEVEPPSAGFGGPTFDVPPVNAPPSYHHQNLPIALRIAADRQRIVELDWALIEACNFDARIDWGTVRDIPMGADGSFHLHTDYVVPASGKAASLDISGHATADYVDGRTLLDNPSAECGMTSTWRATPAFVGTTSQHTPAVIQVAANTRRISRLLLVWVPSCPGGRGLDPPENAIGLDQRHFARIGRAGRFRSASAAHALQTTAEVRLARETVVGHLAGDAVTGQFRATAALGPAGYAARCTSAPVHFQLHR